MSCLSVCCYIYHYFTTPCILPKMPVTLPRHILRKLERHYYNNNLLLLLLYKFYKSVLFRSFGLIYVDKLLKLTAVFRWVEPNFSLTFHQHYYMHSFLSYHAHMQNNHITFWLTIIIYYCCNCKHVHIDTWSHVSQGEIKIQWWQSKYTIIKITAYFVIADWSWRKNLCTHYFN